MLGESIHADITIKTSDGVLKAHKALLASSSPVFESIFQHDLKDKESSTIKIEDMSLDSCSALLSYIYGTIRQDDFWKHRLSLLSAANKYNMADLKDRCEESLLDDINSSNVLERLHDAWLYQLHKLKKGCMTYLFDFGKIYDVKDDISNFFRHVDKELLLEVFQEVLTVWKPWSPVAISRIQKNFTIICLLNMFFLVQYVKLVYLYLLLSSSLGRSSVIILFLYFRSNNRL